MHRKSFWIRQETPQNPILRGRVKADVAIVGGGFTGLACALWIRRAGLEVALVEADCLGGCASAHCAGMVSLTNGLIYRDLEVRRGGAEVSRYVQTQKSAMRAIEALIQEEKQVWNEATVRITGERERLLEEETDAMKRAGIAVEIKRQENRLLMELPHMGVIHPVDYLRLLAYLAAKAGVKLYEKSRAISLETNEVHTERGTIQAPYLVIATGYPIVNVPGWYFLKIQQRESMLVPLAGKVTFDGVWMDASGRFAVRPLARGALMQYNGGYVGTRENREACRKNIRKLADGFGMLADEEQDTGLECCTPDGLPFIGPYGGKTPNLFVASGYGGRGIIGSMIAAQAISARILGLPSDGYDVYSGQRKLPGLRAPLAIGARYAKELASHPMAPHCPHMGCRLVYNAHSRIWECPCHGSRFDDIGHVLNAPAVMDATLQNRKTER